MRSILGLESSLGRRALALSLFTALALGGAACSHARSATPSASPTKPIDPSSALDGRTNRMPPETGTEPFAAPGPRAPRTAAPAPGPMMIQEGQERPEGSAPPPASALPPPLPADTGAVYGAPPPPPLPPPKPAEPQ